MRQRKSSCHKIITQLVMVPFLVVSIFPTSLFAQVSATPRDNTVLTTDASDASQKITLELKGVDILDVLKVLSKKSGLNIVAGRDVRGQVTLYLQNVDVWDAFRTILETSELAYEEKDGIIKVMTERNFEQLYGKTYNDQREGRLFRINNAKASDVANTLNQVKTNVGKIIVDERTNSIIILEAPAALAEMEKYIYEIDLPSKTRIFELRYASVADLEPKITELLTPGTGSIRIDERTNKLVLTDSPEKVRMISQMIEAFDSESQQVLIEAKILTVTLNDNFRLGVRYDVLFNNTRDSKIRATSNFDLTAPVLAGGAGTIAQGLSTLQIEGGDFMAFVDILSSAGKVNVLASPRVTVISGEEARFTSATRQPFVTNTVVQSTTAATNAANVQFVDVGVTLSVTPIITQENKVLMKIRPEVSSLTGELVVGGNAAASDSDELAGTATTRVPIVNTSEAETTVLVENKNIIVLGGLIDETQAREVSKLPILGDLPVVGGAFRSRGDDFDRKELVLFLRATIIDPSEKSKEHQKFFKSEHQLRDFDEVGEYNYDDALYDSHGIFDNRIRPYWQTDGTESEEWQRPKNVYREKERQLELGEYGPYDTYPETYDAPITITKRNRLEKALLPYAQQLRQWIRPAVEASTVKAYPDSQAEVRITLQRDGIVEKILIKSSPRQLALEGELLDGLKAAAPFDDFPQESSSTEQEFYFTVQY